jgi:hypothetical protein
MERHHARLQAEADESEQEHEGRGAENERAGGGRLEEVRAVARRHRAKSPKIASVPTWVAMM